MGSYSDNEDEFFDACEAFASMFDSGSDCSPEDCSTSGFDYDYWVGNLEKGNWNLGLHHGMCSVVVAHIAFYFIYYPNMGTLLGVAVKGKLQAYYNRAITISDRAKLHGCTKDAEELWKQVTKNYEIAVKLNWNSRHALNNWGLALQELSAIVPAREKQTIVRSAISKYGLAEDTSRTGVPVVGNEIPFNELYSQSTIYIAWDGEGETCVIEVTVSGAGSESEAAKIARSVVIYGRDPNWGQIACAAGSAASNYLKEAGDAHGTVKIQISIVEQFGRKGTEEEYEDEGDYEQKLHSTTNKNSV
ncbi:unnamed protein product [Lactuca saligna]|uniref:Glutamate N-acetyltransferase n=1 Tax=Lactuca saligna TaxID=75948 RepID=A0AA36E7X4_LACSI|nr:unnamed protein product [Lactuca saligna]